MTKEIAKLLQVKVDQAAKNFSRTDRECSVGETFEPAEVIAISEFCAMAIFGKNSGKMGCAYFYYFPKGSLEGWNYFFPKDSHLVGFRYFEMYKMLIERENFKANFKQPKNGALLPPELTGAQVQQELPLPVLVHDQWCGKQRGYNCDCYAHPKDTKAARGL